MFRSTDHNPTLARPLQALFVHGMGRSPLSAQPMLRTLRAAGLRTHSFAYLPALQTVPAIRQGLQQRLRQLGEEGDYVVIGHSLGGVLLRSAVAQMPAQWPRPWLAFLLGSPIRASHLAQRFAHRRLYRWATGDAGQMLADAQRMDAIGAMAGVPTVAIVGMPTWPYGRPTAAAARGDGIVSHEEASAPWLSQVIEMPLNHTVMPMSPRLARTILQVIREREAAGGP